MKNNTMKIVIGGHGCMLQISHRSVTLELYVFIYIVLKKKHMTNDLILSNVKEHNSITKIRSNMNFAKNILYDYWDVIFILYIIINIC